MKHLTKFQIIKGGPLLFLLLITQPVCVLAANPYGQALGEYTGGSLIDFLNIIKNFLLGIAGALAVLFIVIGGVMYITSAGNEKRLTAAKQTLTYAIGGLIVVLLSTVILYLIVNVFLANIFTG